MGTCIGLVAFTKGGTLAEHISTPAAIQQTVFDKATHVEEFVKELQERRAGSKEAIPIHIIATPHKAAQSIMKQYQAFLEGRLQVENISHTLHHHEYPDTAEPTRYKTRHNVVIDPVRQTVEMKKSWMHETDHAYTMRGVRAGDGREWYPGLQRDLKKMKPEDYPPNLILHAANPGMKNEELMNVFRKAQRKGS